MNGTSYFFSLPVSILQALIISADYLAPRGHGPPIWRRPAGRRADGGSMNLDGRRPLHAPRRVWSGRQLTTPMPGLQCAAMTKNAGSLANT